MIGIKDLITLSDGNKYAVLGKQFHNNKIYYYVMDVNNFENYKFLYEENNYLTEVSDTNVLKELVPLFSSDLRNILKNREE